MTPDESRAMALWMQTLPPDRRADIQQQLIGVGVEPWLLLTPEEQSEALAALAERQRLTETAHQTPSASEITDVSLTRGMCLGTCPVYRVTLSTDGLVDYEGEAYVERIGQHQGEIDPERVSDLIRVIILLGQADPDPDDVPPLTDQPSAELDLVSERQSYRFSDAEGSPFVWAMAALVDAVVDEVEWDAEMLGDDGDDEDFRADSLE